MSWAEFREEAAKGVDLWWRDDDAVEPTPALDRLIEVHRASGAPLALAVVPSRATPALAERLGKEPGIDILQHGYAHTNHAGAGEKKIEIGAERPAMIVLGDLGTGRMAMERLFGERASPVLVPPWNRIAPVLVPTLPEIGFRGLSRYGARKRPQPVRGLIEVNTHVDLIDWKGGRRFVGEETALGQLVQVLRATREPAPREPIGILSHHLAMDEPGWDFLKSFWGKIASTPGVRILPAREIFASREARV